MKFVDMLYIIIDCLNCMSINEYTSHWCGILWRDDEIFTDVFGPTEFGVIIMVIVSVLQRGGIMCLCSVGEQSTCRSVKHKLNTVTTVRFC